MNGVHHTLASRLIVSILQMAIPIFLISMGVLFLQSREAIHQEAVERANSTVNTTMQRVRNCMTIVETATNSNTWFAETYFEPDSLLALTNRIVRLNSHVNGCSVTARPDMFPALGHDFSAYTIREGDSIITQREAEYDYYSKDWYYIPATLGKACWVDPFDDYNAGTLSNSEIIVSYCKPLYRQGRMIGVISTDLSLRSIDKMINNGEPPYPGAYYVLMGSDDRFFINPKPDHDLGDDQYHVSRCQITGTKWTLALVCPESEMLKDYNYLSYLIASLTILGLLMILWLCRYGVNQAISPLNELLTTTQKISEGQYDQMIPHTDREDAIGGLQNSFATMQESIHNQDASIRQTAEDTRKSNEELAHAMKLVEEALRQKGIFIQNVSHQIRTPLNIIQGFAQVLNDSPDLSKEDLDVITSTMKHNALHLNRMVLMLFDSSETGAIEELVSQRDDQVSCNQIVGECISHTHEHFPDINIKFLTDVNDNFQIRTSHLYLMRTLRELLYNAAKYSDGQHIITHVFRQDGFICFSVEDKGVGLPEASQEIIFNPFIKIDDLSEGLGLGLPLSKRHARSLGGDLTIDTSYHEGCRFILKIPV